MSCFALTVARSGERKSACDYLATTAIERIDLERGRIYRHEKRKFEADKLQYQKGRRRKSNNDFDVVEDELKDPNADLPPEPTLVPAIRIWQSPQRAVRVIYTPSFQEDQSVASIR